MTTLTLSIDDMNIAAQWLAENESTDREDSCKRVAGWLLKLAAQASIPQPQSTPDKPTVANGFVVVANGFVVVPRVPTPEMIEQGCNSVRQFSEKRFLSVWNATLAAAHANE